MEIINPNITGSLIISASVDITGVLSASTISNVISESAQVDYYQLLNKPDGTPVTSSEQFTQFSDGLSITGSLSLNGGSQNKALSLNGANIYTSEFSITNPPSYIELFELPLNSAGNAILHTNTGDVSRYEYEWVYSDNVQSLVLLNSNESPTSSLGLELDTDNGFLRTKPSGITRNAIVYIQTFDELILRNIESSSIEIKYLVVAGGGGGGGVIAGGGGAGGYLEGSIFTQSLQSQIYTVTVGGGGTGGLGWNNYGAMVGGNGGNSVFRNITSIGGGGGALYTGTASTAATGGSGGGATLAQLAGSGTEGQGNDGGANPPLTGNNSGGGGGASEKGYDAVASTSSGNGGAGKYSSITGTLTAYAGGGGGGTRSGYGSAGTGGVGGGGNGTASTATAQSGTANTGGGGGGGGYNAKTSNSRIGGNGGSGIVVLKLPISTTVSGGTGLTYTTTDTPTHKILIFESGTGNIELTV